jgi:hypothetical protein
VPQVPDLQASNRIPQKPCAKRRAATIVQTVLNRPTAFERHFQHKTSPKTLTGCSAKLDGKKPDCSASRYQLLRQHSRSSGRCSWTVFDSKAHTTIFVADNGKAALAEIDRLEAPPQKWTYKTRAGTGVITNDDPDVVDQSDYDDLIV